MVISEFQTGLVTGTRAQSQKRSWTIHEENVIRSKTVVTSACPQVGLSVGGLGQTAWHPPGQQSRVNPAPRGGHPWEPHAAPARTGSPHLEAECPRGSAGRQGVTAELPLHGEPGAAWDSGG